MLNFIVWAVLLVIFIIIEFETVELRAIWFALGAALVLIGLAIPFIAERIWIQIFLFLLAAGLSMYFLRPITKRYLKVKETPTNADRNIGKIGMVEETIDNLENKGVVKVGGKTWTARALANDPIPAGNEVEILRIEGVKLIVKPANNIEE